MSQELLRALRLPMYVLPAFLAVAALAYGWMPEPFGPFVLSVGMAMMSRADELWLGLWHVKAGSSRTERLLRVAAFNTIFLALTAAGAVGCFVIAQNSPEARLSFEAIAFVAPLAATASAGYVHLVVARL